MHLLGIDADEEEIELLNSKDVKDKFIPMVLEANNGRGKLYITQDPACSSLYPPDEDLILIRPTSSVTNLANIQEVEISTLDDWKRTKGIANIDFMKLAVQEAELDVLQGAEKFLESVRMLEVEVEFTPIYSRGTSFW